MQIIESDFAWTWEVNKMLVSSKKIEKMLRDRDRLERMAKIEYQEAKDLFSVGNMEFAIELQLANQHLGASREITRTLKNIGYEECKRNDDWCYW